MLLYVFKTLPVPRSIPVKLPWSYLLKRQLAPIVTHLQCPFPQPLCSLRHTQKPLIWAGETIQRIPCPTGYKTKVDSHTSTVRHTQRISLAMKATLWKMPRTKRQNFVICQRNQLPRNRPQRKLVVWKRIYTQCSWEKNEQPRIYTKNTIFQNWRRKEDFLRQDHLYSQINFRVFVTLNTFWCGFVWNCP